MFILVCAWFVGSLHFVIISSGKMLRHEDCLDYGCSFFAKLSWTKIFFGKNMVVTNYTLIAEKMFLYGKKKFILKTFFTEKSFFCREKYEWKCKKTDISFEKYIFMQIIFVLQIKYKYFWNIYSFCQKTFFWS